MKIVSLSFDDGTIYDLRFIELLNKYHFEAYSNKDKKGIRTLFIRVLNGKFHVCLITGDTKISEECVNDLSKIENLESLYPTYIDFKNKFIRTFYIMDSLNLCL